MRVLFLINWVDLQSDARERQIAQDLERLGHEVDVVTSVQQFQAGKIDNRLRTTWGEDAGTGEGRSRRVPAPAPVDSSGVKRLLSLGISAVSTGIATLRMKRPDVAYVPHPPGTSAVPALILRLVRAVPVVSDRELAFDAEIESFAEALNSAGRSRHRYERTKRGIDVAISMVGLVVLAAPLGALALAVRHKLGRPVLFKQVRPGRHGKEFTILKFRTMIDAKDPEGNLLPDAERLTPFGSLLRATSLDELPELINVLRGDMSLVGPRPLLPQYTEFFTAVERCRMDVRPGITGVAQVRGRNRASWDDRLALDAWYVRNLSPLLDLRILAETVVGVFRRSGVVVDPESAMQNLDDERRERVPSRNAP